MMMITCNHNGFGVDWLFIPLLKRGKATSVMSTRNLGAILGDIFQPFDWPIDSQPALSLPVKDEVGKGGSRIASFLLMQVRHLESMCILLNKHSEKSVWTSRPVSCFPPQITWLSLGHERLWLTLEVLLLWAYPTETRYLSPLDTFFQCHLIN